MLKKILSAFLLLFMSVNCLPNFTFGCDSEDDISEIENSFDESMCNLETPENSFDESTVEYMISKALNAYILDEQLSEDSSKKPISPEDLGFKNYKKLFTLTDTTFKKSFFKDHIETYKNFFDEENNMDNTIEALLYKNRFDALFTLISLAEKCPERRQFPSSIFKNILHTLLACCSEKYQIDSVIDFFIPLDVIEYYITNNFPEDNFIDLIEILRGKLKCNKTYAAYLFVRVFYNFFVNNLGASQNNALICLQNFLSSSMCFDKDSILKFIVNCINNKNIYRVNYLNKQSSDIIRFLYNNNNDDNENNFEIIYHYIDSFKYLYINDKAYTLCFYTPFNFFPYATTSTEHVPFNGFLYNVDKVTESKISELNYLRSSDYSFNEDIEILGLVFNFIICSSDNILNISRKELLLKKIYQIMEENSIINSQIQPLFNNLHFYALNLSKKINTIYKKNPLGEKPYKISPYNHYNIDQIEDFFQDVLHFLYKNRSFLTNTPS